MHTLAEHRSVLWRPRLYGNLIPALIMHTLPGSHAARSPCMQGIALFCDGLGYGNLCGLANDPAIWPEDVRPEDYDMLDTVGQENCR